MEHDPAIGVRTFGTIFQVTLYSATNLRKLRADLVVSPRDQFNLDQRVVGGGSDRLVT